MGVLVAKIDRRRGVIEFSGDTFLHRESIKALGAAAWEPARKVWRVTSGELDAAQLHARFPGIVIDDLSASANGDESRDSRSTTTSTNGGQTELLNQEPILDSRLSKANQSPTTINRSEPTESASLLGLPPNISVAELMVKAESAIQRTFTDSIYVRGVIASVKSSGDGKVFLSLAEEGALEQTLQCVIWSQEVHKVLAPLKAQGLVLEANLAIMFGGNVRFNKRRGEISFSITSVVPEYTMSRLLAQREKTNERLKKEGLFDRNRRTVLPLLPRQLGLITSTSGTVIHDFRTALDQSRFGFELLWCHSAMQGESAAREIVAAIRTLEKRRVDAILLFRGGGSVSDLAVFNDYAVAKAICQCSVPVFSAIGHQEDQSSAQDVSFHSEGVPQALGRYFAQRIIQFRTDVEQRAKVIVHRAAAVLELWLERSQSNARAVTSECRRVVTQTSENTRRATDLINRYAVRRCHDSSMRTVQLGRIFSISAAAVLGHYRRVIEQYPGTVMQHLHRALRYRQERLESVSAVVKASSPEVQLQRGFAIVRLPESQHYVTSGADISSGAELEVVFHDGSKRVKALN